MSERYRFLFLLLVVVSASFTFINSVFFLISDITFKGNKSLSGEELLMISNIGERANFFRLDEKVIAKNLEEHPIIRKAVVHKLFPSSLKIEIEERVALAVLPKEGHFVEIDSEGVAMKFTRSPDDAMPIITGIDTSVLTLGERVQTPGLESALEIIVNLSEDTRKELSEINLTVPIDIHMYTIDGLKIYIGQAERLANKVRVLESILKNINERGLKVEYVDIRYENAPVVK